MLMILSTKKKGWVAVRGHLNESTLNHKWLNCITLSVINDTSDISQLYYVIDNKIHVQQNDVDTRQLIAIWF